MKSECGTVLSALRATRFLLSILTVLVWQSGVSAAEAQTSLVISKRVAATATGAYNVDVVTKAAPHDSRENEAEGGAAATTLATIAEGAVSATAYARADSGGLSAESSVRASAGAGLGSTALAATSSELFEGFVFGFARFDVRSVRVVTRVRGRARFADASRVAGTARANLSGVFVEGIIGSAPESELELLGRLTWEHFSPTTIPVVARERTLILPLTSTAPGEGILQLLFGVPYNFKLRLDTHLSCGTGSDARGTVLPAYGFGLFGAGAETVALDPPVHVRPPRRTLGPLNAPEEAPGLLLCPGTPFGPEGAIVEGLQFLNAQGVVLDLQAGEVEFTSDSGIVYPVLGRSLPWLSSEDDFDDRAGNAELWRPSEEDGVLVEKEFVLDYSAPAGHHTAHWVLDRHHSTFNESWEVQADLHLEAQALLNEGDSVAIGLKLVRGAGGAELGTLRLLRQKKDGAVDQAFLATSVTAAASEGSVPANGMDAAVKIRYNALTGELYYFGDSDGARNGYSWTRVHSTVLDRSPENDDNPAQIKVQIGGRSTGQPVPTGSAWLDNFSARSWTPVAAHLDRVIIQGTNLIVRGCAEPGLEVHLESSQDLTKWSQLATSRASEEGILAFSIPSTSTLPTTATIAIEPAISKRPNAYQFFRLRL